MAIEKYVVFKKEEFCKWFDDVYDGLGPAADDVLNTSSKLGKVEDAVVIRRRDSFAPPALDAYSNSIQIVLEMFDEDDGAHMDSDIRDNLRTVADYFHEQAKLAWETHRGLPTP